MLAVTMILAALVLLMMIQLPSSYSDPEVPAIFKILTIKQTNDYGRNTLNSYMTIENTGTTGYLNLNLYAMTYRNGKLLSSSIATLNGHAFISTHHYGVQTFGGQGSKKRVWDPNERAYIDFKDGTFHTGDVVTFEVYDTVTGQIISRHTVTA